MSLLPSKPIFNEKRLLPRWKIVSPAKIKWQGSEGYAPCEVKDLNMKGFCLSSLEKIPESNDLVELYFNDKYFFEVETSVIWHKEVDGKQIYGFKFLRICDYNKEKMYQMMKENFSSNLTKPM